MKEYSVIHESTNIDHSKNVKIIFDPIFIDIFDFTCDFICPYGHVEESDGQIIYLKNIDSDLLDDIAKGKTKVTKSQMHVNIYGEFYPYKGLVKFKNPNYTYILRMVDRDFLKYDQDLDRYKEHLTDKIINILRRENGNLALKNDILSEKQTKLQKRFDNFKSRNGPCR